MSPKEVLEKYFGFREFLDAQEEVVNALVSGDDALVVMPTGGGKSLCYQLPALMMDGVTVVVSPLIALMKDQVDALERRGIAATLINSSLSPAEQSARIRRLAAGEFKLVYIAPERFRHRAFTEALGQATISLFAVDEAHCMSQWGHDFRPDYFRLGEVLEKLGRPQCAAFTATATPEVRKDILERLNLREPREFVAGFARPNLRLSVHKVDREAEKYDRLLALIKEHKTGIVYCATRKRVEAVSASLLERKVKLITYHGGLSDTERENAQNLFISRQADVAVATNAFGMGIDRSDIRFVAHFEVPGSVEAYYQEAGRAGRDGEPSVCELYFNFADTRVQDFFIEGSNPSREVILQTYETLRRAADTETGEVRLPIREIAARVADSSGEISSAAGSEMAVSSALSILNRGDFIERFDIAGERVRGTRVSDLKLRRHDIKLDWPGLAEKERRDRDKLRRILELVDTRQCRQESILRYFGEPNPGRCGNCDVCSDSARFGRREGTEQEVTLARKALSGVARMCGKSGEGAWQGRFGKGRIIQVLLGSRSKEIVDARQDQLTTHGLLKDEGASYVNELFRELQSAGHLAIEQRTGFDGKPYQLLTLTPAGDAVMRGRQNPELSWPERATPGTKGSGKSKTTERPGGRRHAASPDSATLPPVDEGLLSAMKKKRFELARERNLPAYNIFPDATLETLARLRPQSPEAARHIRGIGELKAERYLPFFLAIIQEHAARDEGDPDAVRYVLFDEVG